jgi:hypothetical protein
MEWLTSYYTILSTTLAIFILILLPLTLYCIIFPPDYVEAEFRAPKGYQESGTRILNVLEHPAEKDMAFLLFTFLVDIFVLYPFTVAGSQEQISWLSRIGGLAILALQFSAAVGWCGIRSDWLAGKRNFGLWNNTSWAIYYVTFILMTFACVCPLIFMGIGLATGPMISQTLNIWMALYHAYKPLIPEIVWSFVFKSTKCIWVRKCGAGQ